MKIIAFLLFPFFLFLLQFAFLPAVFHFALIPNLLMLTVAFYTLLENPNKNGAFFLALYVGFLHDLVLYGFFGTYMVIFFAAVFFLKYILKNHVQISAFKKT